MTHFQALKYPLLGAICAFGVMSGSVHAADGFYTNKDGCAFVRITIDGTMGWAPVYDLSEGSPCPAPGMQTQEAPAQTDVASVVDENPVPADAPAPKEAEATAPVAVQQPATEPEPKPEVQPAPEPATPAVQPEPPAAAAGPRIQMALFGNPENTKRALAMLGDKKLPADLRKITRAGRQLDLLRAGPFADKAAAQKALVVLRENGFPDAYIIGK